MRDTPTDGTEHDSSVEPDPDGGSHQRLVRQAAECVVVKGAIALRAIFVVQLSLSMFDSIGYATRPAVFLVVSLLALAESVLFAALLWRQQRFGARLATFDVIAMTLLVLGEPIYTSPADRADTWVAWALPAAMSAAVSVGIGWRRWPMSLGGGALLAGAYFAVTLPGAVAEGMGVTVLTNGAAIIGFAFVSRLFVGFYLTMASVADDARQEAALAAAAAELDRQRLLLHDQATVLTLLARGESDPIRGEALRGQALTMSARIRALLATEPRDTSGTNDTTSLAQIATEVCAAFSDLPVTMNIDLARHVEIPADQTGPLLAALETVLQNVRCHAEATTVIVHASSSGEAWELSVRDNGIGFDAALVKPGFGMQVQAGAALRRVGIAVAVDAAPGEGTGIIMTGPMKELSR